MTVAWIAETAIAATTGTAVRAGIATAAEAVANGSDRADVQSIGDKRKSRRIPTAFSHCPPLAMTGEYPAGLLDIGGSLC